MGRLRVFFPKEEVYIFQKKEIAFQNGEKNFCHSLKESKTLDVSISTNTYVSVSVTNGASKRTIRLNKLREKIFAKTFAEVQAKKLLEN